jgi:sporulation protein YlmC with PRC-barrel domain
MAISAMSAGTLIGDTVKNSGGEELGNLEEIMIDLESGRVAYAVLSAGGILGMGNKLFAVPWSMVGVDLDDESVVIDLDEETIENAPGFDKDNWPEASDVGWMNEVYDHYGAERYWDDENG